MSKISLLVVVCLIGDLAGETAQRSSPCPRTFQYTSEETSQEGKWYGRVNLNTDVTLRGVWLRIRLDRPAVALVNWFGESTTRNNWEFTIKDPEYVLEPGPPVSLRFYVEYNATRPNLIGIWLNGRVVCPSTDVNTRTSDATPPTPFVSINLSPTDDGIDLMQGKLDRNNVESDRRKIDIKLIRQPQAGSDYFSGDFPLLRPQGGETIGAPFRLQPPSAKCGTVTGKASPLITSGYATHEGEWPWHVAIYRSEGIQLTYICGGNLLSTRYVLTAAHCVTRPRTVKPSNVQGLLLYLGAHNLRHFGPGIQVLQISDVVVHPDYNSVFYHNDLALLRLSRSADITDYVRTVCLWEDGPGLEGIVGKLGTVVGWGFDENKRISEELMQAQMPVVSTSKCIYSKPDFFSRFTSETSYCAGFRNGTSVCNGDSGGGMTFVKEGNGQEKVWQLRGVVSIGLPLQGQTLCDPSKYIIFSDVAPHLDWITGEITKQ